MGAGQVVVVMTNEPHHLEKYIEVHSDSFKLGRLNWVKKKYRIS